MMDKISRIQSPRSVVALTYAFVSTAWIAGSDYLFQAIKADPALQTVKGIVFVTVTAFMLHFFVKRYGVKLREHERRLYDAERMQVLGERTARISHELRNVLMAVKSLSAVLHRFTTDCPQASKTSKHLQSALNRGELLLSEVLGFAASRPARTEPLVLNSWLSEFSEVAKTTVRADLAIDVTIVPPELIANADPSQLHQLLINLIMNANDAIGPQGRISIHASAIGEPASGVTLTVRDNGSGMSPETARHAFDPLFTTKRQGTGLGLPVVARIAEAHGGSVKLESEVGSGTAFHIFLPHGATVVAAV